MPILSLNDFQDKLLINQYSFGLVDNLRQSQTVGGQVLTSQVGPRLWTGSISITQHSHMKNREAAAMLSNIQNPNTQFLFSPPKGMYPADDPTGSIMGATTPRITSPVSGYAMTISGLPANYKITAGDYVSYELGGVHRMHQFAETKAANASGVLSAIRLINPIMAGNVPANNTLIKLIKPTITVQFVPGSMSGGNVLLDRIEGISFSFTQSVKAAS